MHSDMYEPICFKFVTMIDSTELLISIKSLCDLDIDSRSLVCKTAKKKLCANYLLTQSMDLGGIWHAVQTCGSDKTHIHFIFDQFSRERLRIR